MTSTKTSRMEALFSSTVCSIAAASSSRSSGKLARVKTFCSGCLGIEEALPVVIDQTLEDRLLGAEVVVEVADRLIAGLGDLAHRGRAVALGGEEFQRRLQHLGGGDLRPFGLASVGSPSAFSFTNRTFVL